MPSAALLDSKRRAIARRQGAGKLVVLADVNEQTLQAAADALESAGHAVTTRHVDVSSRDSVQALAADAAKLGPVAQVVHTAGVSPVQASVLVVLAVNLYGVAVVLEEFGRVIAPGGAGLVISSGAGYMLPALPPEQNTALSQTPAEELLDLPFLSEEAVPNSGIAYSMSKRANHLRVQAAAVPWGDRGARVNEIAAAAAFLLGPDASFVTGSDLLVDGGVIATIRAGRVQLPR